MKDYLEGAAPNCLFPGKLVDVARRVREAYPKSSYDHRLWLPKLDESHPFTEIVLSEQFRVGYACFKREVARAIAPETIVEIGIGIGVSALAFMDACPKARYLGLDNDSDHEKKFTVKPSDFVASAMFSKGYSCELNIVDSQKITILAPGDLVHIDGCHDYYATIHDFTMAWRSKAPWILIDDCRDSTVAAAVLWVIHQLRPGSFEWTYFEDTWTGSILVSQEVSRP
jgi:Methyltransferase domain